MTTQLFRSTAFGIAALILCGGYASAQHVEFRGRGDFDTDRRIEQLLAGAHTAITGDTVIAEGTTLRGPVLVAGATMRVNGTIDGDLYIVDGNVFLRPTGRVTGAVYNYAGGFYPSEQATISGTVHSDPNAPYEVERGDGVLRIVGVEQRTSFAPRGLKGLLIPTYDRVNGVTLGVGADYIFPRLGRLEPRVGGHVEYRSARGDVTGGAELGVRRNRTELLGGVERGVYSEDTWIRSDFSNSIGFLWDGDDFRNYYAADRAYASVLRTLQRGPRTIDAFVRAQVEESEPLRTRSVWTILGDDPLRENPAVTPRTITSLFAGADVEWELPRFVAELGGEIELAGSMLGGEEEFARFEVTGEGAMPAFANHSLEVEAHVRAPLGTETLPLQRWSFVGGSGTLYTYDVGEFRGDRVVAVQTSYIIPFPARFERGMLGRPVFELLHLAGMAWSADVDRSIEHNIGVRVRWAVINVRAVTNPANAGDDLEFSVGLSAPRRAHPWERPQ